MEFKAQDAEKRLEVLTSQVGKVGLLKPWVNNFSNLCFSSRGQVEKVNYFKMLSILSSWEWDFCKRVLKHLYRILGNTTHKISLQFKKSSSLYYYNLEIFEDPWSTVRNSVDNGPAPLLFAT